MTTDTNWTWCGPNWFVCGYGNVMRQQVHSTDPWQPDGGWIYVDPKDIEHGPFMTFDAAATTARSVYETGLAVSARRQAQKMMAARAQQGAEMGMRDLMDGQQKKTGKKARKKERKTTLEELRNSAA